MYSIKYHLSITEKMLNQSTDLYAEFMKQRFPAQLSAQNDYFLPVSYCVNSAIDVWDTTEEIHFQIQADFFTLATEAFPMCLHRLNIFQPNITVCMVTILQKTAFIN